MKTPIQVLRVIDPRVLDSPEFVDLFRRGYSESKFRIDADAARRCVRDEIAASDSKMLLFVARSSAHGLCGFAIAVRSGDPLMPVAQVPHFFADAPGARAALTRTGFDYLTSCGEKEVAIHNMTGATDQAHMRMFRKFADGNVEASLILYQLKVRQ